MRDHPKFGVEVVGKREVPVLSYADIEQQIAIGTNNRTVGSTLMNNTSSRAHTVTCITFVQKEFDK